MDHEDWFPGKDARDSAMLAFRGDEDKRVEGRVFSISEELANDGRCAALDFYFDSDCINLKVNSSGRRSEFLLECDPLRCEDCCNVSLEFGFIVKMKAPG